MFRALPSVNQENKIKHENKKRSWQKESCLRRWETVRSCAPEEATGISWAGWCWWRDTAPLTHWWCSCSCGWRDHGAMVTVDGGGGLTARGHCASLRLLAGRWLGLVSGDLDQYWDHWHWHQALPPPSCCQCGTLGPHQRHSHLGRDRSGLLKHETPHRVRNGWSIVCAVVDMRSGSVLPVACCQVPASVCLGAQLRGCTPLQPSGPFYEGYKYMDGELEL